MDFSVFKNKYFIEGELVVLTALHIGSGKEEAEHDAPFMKEDGNFYIPGSSFRGYLRTKLEGYNLINNIRKIDELIFNRGSVFTFEVNNYKDELELLNKIEEEGIGLRKNEGFGRVKICSSRGDN